MILLMDVSMQYLLSLLAGGFQFLTAHFGHFLGAAQRAQAGHGGTEDVVRVVGADSLGEHVRDGGGFHDGAGLHLGNLGEGNVQTAAAVTHHGIELIEKTTGLITKRIKPNFKTLGPRYGKWMKQIAALVAEFSQERIAEVEAAPETVLDLGAERITVTPADFEITSEDMPGWLVASEGKLTVALDITVTEELKAEGVARELINRIQNIRKDSGFEVTDKIRAEIEQKPLVADAIARFAGYIASQTLAVEVRPAAEPAGETVVETDVDDEPLRIAVTRI